MATVVGQIDAVSELFNGQGDIIVFDKPADLSSATLKTLAKKIDTDRMRAPAFLLVLTGVGKYAYKREDGVFVVPIGCLKD